MVNITGEKVRFYGLISLMNLAVGVMFYTTSITPAPVSATPTPNLKPVAAAPQVIPATQGIPTKVTVPSLSIDLPVKIGTYTPENGNWTVDNSGAYYADSSMPINNSNGTTMIYGHAQSPVFATLPQIQPDSTATVTTDTGYVFHYRYLYVKEVAPNDVSVFTASGPPTLVLQTCVGVFSERRALFYFKLESIETL